MDQDEPFSPLAERQIQKKELGMAVVNAMLARSVTSLPPPKSFTGAGIYAIYYVGGYPAYKLIAEANRDDQFKQPIYVGKAVPAGTRKGGFDLGLSAGQVLYRRLGEHASSVMQVSNLEVADFRCRYLIVDDIWIPLGESLLIELFSPIWNRVIDGFGNHDPRKGRYNQQRSAWDVLHPGRLWAQRVAPNVRTEAEILASLARYLAERTKS